MDLSKLIATKKIFTGPEDEELNILEYSSVEVFISKTCIRKIDFNGNVIGSLEDEIRTKSVWSYNLESDMKKEVIPYDEFDINDSYLAGNYLYYVKIVDEDNDGLLLESDYLTGEMWRLRVCQ